METSRKLELALPFASFLRLSLLALLGLVPLPASTAELARPGTECTGALELSRAVQPWEFLSAVGRRAALLGRENGQVEAWVYPLKIFRDFALQFRVGDRLLEAESLARTVTVWPEAASILYAGDTFVVRETWFAPVEEPGAFILVEIETAEPLAVEASFTRDFQLMWPAGLGGTYMVWSEDLRAFVFGEEQRRFYAVVGSPSATNPQREFFTNAASSPRSQFSLGRVERGRQQFLIVISASHRGRSEAEDTYQSLQRRFSPLCEEAAKYYEKYLNETVSVRLPDARLEEAYNWSRVSVVQGVVKNPFLGTGLIAGYGTSGKNHRPGFAWYFGRDALWTVLALNVAGDFVNARTALEFLIRYQRQDGKITHEISHSASFVPWFTDFPYPWAAADATPLFLLAVNDYAVRAGDLDFVHRHWDSLRRAYQFLQSTLDEHGFAKNTGVGHGWVEGGPLLPVKTELYQSGLGVAATGALANLARLAGKNELAEELERDYRRLTPALNQAFWLPEKQYYAFALDQNNNRVHESSVLAMVPLWFDLLEAEKVNPMLNRLAAPDHATDWGMRIISSQSRHYWPAGYHFGSVWPLFTGWASVAAYRSHRPQVGYATLLANALLALEGSLGHVTEVLSGASYAELSTSSPHQVWSAAMVISPLLRGLLGVEQDAPANRLVFSPHIPAHWDFFELRNLRVGGANLDLAYRRTSDAITLELRRSGTGECEVEFSPAVSLRAHILAVEVNDRPVPFRLQANALDQHVVVHFPVYGAINTLRIHLQGDFALQIPVTLPSLGATSSNLKLISQSWNSSRDQLEMEVSGLTGSEYDLPLRGADEVATVEGAELVASEAGEARLRIRFPAAETEKYIRRKVRIHFISRQARIGSGDWAAAH